MGGWAAAAIVPGLLSLALVPLLLYRLYPPEVAESPEAPEEARRQLEQMGPMSRAEIALAAIVGCCLVLWTTTGWHTAWTPRQSPSWAWEPCCWRA